MGSTAERPSEDDPALATYSAGPAHATPQPITDVLYTFLEFAATDAFRLPSDATESPRTPVMNTGNGHGERPRSILREGSLGENIAGMRQQQVRQLTEYQTMVEIAAKRVDEDETDETAPVSQSLAPSSESAKEDGQMSPSERSTRSTNGMMTPDRLLTLMREAASIAFSLPKDKDHSRSKRNAIDGAKVVHPAASHSHLNKAVSALRCEQRARMVECQRMCDVAMSRSADDFGVSEEQIMSASSSAASGDDCVRVPEEQIRAFVEEATSLSGAPGDDCIHPKVISSEPKSVYRDGQGLSTEVAAVRQEIADRLDEHKKLCNIAKPVPSDAKLHVSKDLLMSYSRSAISQDFSTFHDTNSSKRYLGEGQNSILRTSATEELCQEFAGRLMECREMSRVATSRSYENGCEVQSTKGTHSTGSLLSTPSDAIVGDILTDILSILRAASSDDYLRFNDNQVSQKKTRAVQTGRHTLRGAVGSIRSDLQDKHEEFMKMCAIAKTRSVEEQCTSAKAKTKHPSPSTPAQPKLASPRRSAQPVKITLKPSPCFKPHTGSNFGMTAPRFTEEDEAREKAALTAQEKAEAEALMKGTKLPPTPHVSEYDSLDELELELRKIPDDEKAEFMEAEAKCPEIAKDGAFLLNFLRCVSVNFDAKAAARRVVAYWKRRVELFGQEKAFLPLSVETSLVDDEEALATGAYRILPDTDDSGRRVIVYGVRRQRPDKCSRDSMLRVYWYMVHATLENCNPNANGYVVLLLPTDGTNEVFDRKLCKFMVDLDRDCLPNQITAWHHTLSTPQLPVYAPFWKHQLGPRIRRVLTVHGPEMEENVERLGAEFGLPLDRLMTEVGGEVKLDHMKWTKDRRNQGI